MLSVSLDGVIAVTDMDQRLLLYKLELPNVKLMKIVDLKDRDSILINVKDTNKVIYFNFNLLEMEEDRRNSSFRFISLHHCLIHADNKESRSCIPLIKDEQFVFKKITVLSLVA